MSGAPDLIDPVVGFRAWRIVGDQLLSPFIPCRWEGTVMHAECYDANRTLTRGEGWLDGEHESPHPDCQCGIYAYHRPGFRSAWGDFHWAEGVITVWGRLEAHADGLRAEHAQVWVLAEPPANEPLRRDAVRGVAARLDLPLVPRAELGEVAASLGAPLPESLRAPS